jgi:hypothetical protein
MQRPFYDDEVKLVRRRLRSKVPLPLTAKVGRFLTRYPDRSSATLEAARIGTQYVYLKGGRRTLDHLGSYQASR